MVTLGIRPLDRYGGACAIRDFPSDIAACHRAARRHTCSPGTRRSTRARQAQTAPGAHVGQSAPQTPLKRATRLATGPRSAWAARWQVGREHCLSRNATKRHALTIFASHFRDRVHLKKYHLESGLHQRDEVPHDFFVTQVPMSPRGNSLSGGVSGFELRTTRKVVL